jgi:hypothetical protein
VRLYSGAISAGFDDVGSEVGSSAISFSKSIFVYGRSRS